MARRGEIIEVTPAGLQDSSPAEPHAPIVQQVAALLPWFNKRAPTNFKPEFAGKLGFYLETQRFRSIVSTSQTRIEQDA